MNYRFSEACAKVDPVKLWNDIQCGLSKNVIIKSVREGKLYTIRTVDSNAISYSSPKRSGGQDEQILKSDFIELVRELQKLKLFNSSTAKNSFPSAIYRKRSPIFAILVSATMIEPI